MKEIYEAPLLELIEYQTEESITLISGIGDNDLVNPWRLFS